MARRTPNEGSKARQERAVRDEGRRKAAERFATRASLQAAQGPAVVAVQLKVSGRLVLVKRIDLVEMMKSGVWPRPITATVRQMMLMGNVASAWQVERMDVYAESAMAIARAACLAPTPELLAGEVGIGDLDPRHMKPLFVKDDPDEDQMILVTEAVRAAQVERITIMEQTGDPDLEASQARLAAMCVLHFGDLATLAGNVIDNMPGALAAFRPVAADAVGRVPEPEDDGEADECADCPEPEA